MNVALAPSDQRHDQTEIPQSELLPDVARQRSTTRGIVSGALFASEPGNGDMLLTPQGLIFMLPMLLLCLWIVVSGRLTSPRNADGATIV